MKLLKIFFVFIFLLTTVAFCSCGNDAPAEQPTETTPVDSTAGESGGSSDITEPYLGIKIIENGTTQYRVVRTVNASKEVKDAALDLKYAIDSKYSTKISMGNDFEKPDADPSERYQYEILVGDTNRDESIAAQKLIKYNDFIISMNGTRVVITGGSDEAVVEAVKYFIKNYVNGDSLELSSKLLYIQKGLYTDITIDGVSVSDFTVVYSEAYKSTVETFATRMGETLGAKLKLVEDIEETTSAHKIVIGSSENTGAFGSDDFKVSIKEGNIHITGGSKDAIAMGCAHFANVFWKVKKQRTLLTILHILTLCPTETNT